MLIGMRNKDKEKILNEKFKSVESLLGEAANEMMGLYSLKPA